MDSREVDHKVLACREVEDVRECSSHVTHPLRVDTQAVGVGIQSVGVGIRMKDVHQEAAGIRLVVNNRQAVAADNLRHIAVVVEEPYTAAEGSQPFCFCSNRVAILYRAHPKDA